MFADESLSTYFSSAPLLVVLLAQSMLRGRTLLAIGIIIAQAVLISALLIERRRTKRAAQKCNEAEQRLAELTARLLRTQDEERRRIARELHDVTAQSMGLIVLNLAQMQNGASAMDQKSKDKLTESFVFAEQALKDIRTLSYVLHPPLLEQAGLVTAMDWYVRGFSERSGVNISFAYEDGDRRRLPPEVEYALFRIVQESLTNIRRHTNSETAEITLKRTADEVLMSIRDEGTGTKLELPRNNDRIEMIGVGIPGMRHRLKQLGGDLLVDSDPNGTTVTARVPVR